MRSPTRSKTRSKERESSIKRSTIKSSNKRNSSKKRKDPPAFEKKWHVLPRSTLFKQSSSSNPRSAIGQSDYMHRRYNPIVP